MGDVETLYEVAVDLALRLASAEAQAWADLGLEHVWEHREEALLLYMERIEAAMHGGGVVEAGNRRAGRTCHIVGGDRHNHAPHCDLCGAVVQDALPSFCPHCGARVVK